MANSKYANVRCIWFDTTTPDSKVHGANMGPIWGREDPGGPHVGPMNFAIWDIIWTNHDTEAFEMQHTRMLSGYVASQKPLRQESNLCIYMSFSLNNKTWCTIL